MGRIRNILKGKDKNPDEKEENMNPGDSSDIDNPELNPDENADQDDAPPQDSLPGDSSEVADTSDNISENKFFLGNKRKHYVIDKNYCDRKKAKQIIKGDKVVYSDTGIECSYYLNFTPEEAERYRNNGKIF